MKGTAIVKWVETVASELGGEFYTSKRGVPLVILTLSNGRKGNLCYFGTTNTWRWFYPSWEFDIEPTRTDFNSIASFKEFLEVGDHPDVQLEPNRSTLCDLGRHTECTKRGLRKGVKPFCSNGHPETCECECGHSSIEEFLS